MPTLSGTNAIAWMQAKVTNIPGTCLNTVWQAYGSHASIGPHAGQYPNAIDGWNYATRQHPGDMNPPAGVPCYYGPSPTRRDSDAGAGDIVISIGGGQCIATDANGNGGRIGTLSLSKRASDISRPYLGWTEDFLGYDVDYGRPAHSESTSTPLTLELGEETMSAPIYARGDQLDVWYALYTNCQDSTVPRDSGQIYSGRRKVSAGERAIVEGYQKQTGKLHPLSDQTSVIVISQATFDGINKVQGSDA